MILILLAALALTLGSCAAPPPEDPDLALHRGRNALALGRYDWARRYFEQDLASHPDRAESLRGMGLGWISGFEGSLTRGTEMLAAYLEKNPEDEETRQRLARSWLRLGETERALTVLETAAESGETHELRAQALESSDATAAEREVLAALAVSPEAPASLLLAAQLAHRRGDSSVAQERALAATRADPLRGETYYLLAQIRRSLQDDEGAQQALEIYQQLRQLPVRGRPSKLSPYEELQVLRSLEPQLNTTASLWRKRMARILLANGDPAAETTARALIAESDGDAFDFLELASEAHARAQSELARALYQHALELDPELKAARAQLARLENETGDRETARKLLTAGLEADPYHAPFHFTSGLVALQEGQEEEAIRAFERALELVPWLASYRIALADVYLAAGRREDLERVLDEAPAEDPTITAYRRRHLGR